MIAVRAYNSPLVLAAMLWTGVVSVFTTVVLPLVVAAVGAGFHLAGGPAGYAASAEMGGIALGAFVAGARVGKADRRGVVLIGALLAAAANGASALVHDYPVLLGLRVSAGIGSGALLAAMAASVGATVKPDRNFAIFVAAAFLSASAGFALLSGAGTARLFLALAALNLGALATTPLFPRRPPDVAAEAGPAGASGAIPKAALIALGGILAYYVGVGTVWPSMAGLGAALGVAPAAIARTLAGTSIAGMSGAILAAVLATRIGRLVPLVIGLSTVVGSLAWLGSVGASAFGLAPFLFLFAWNFSVPYMLGTLAALDASGRAVAFNMTLQYIGFAVGPLLGAAIAASHPLTALVWFASGCCAISLLLFWTTLRIRPSE